MFRKPKYYIVQRNKYFDDLGFKPNQYGVNFIAKREKRKRLKQWKNERKLYGFDSRETWCLDSMFAEWLYTRCTMYLEKASEVVNLDYYKFNFRGKEYTQREAIERIRQWSLYYVKNRYESGREEKAVKALTAASELWTIILPYMWW